MVLYRDYTARKAGKETKYTAEGLAGAMNALDQIMPAMNAIFDRIEDRLHPPPPPSEIPNEGDMFLVSPRAGESGKMYKAESVNLERTQVVVRAGRRGDTFKWDGKEWSDGAGRKVVLTLPTQPEPPATSTLPPLSSLPSLLPPLSSATLPSLLPPLIGIPPLIPPPAPILPGVALLPPSLIGIPGLTATVQPSVVPVSIDCSGYSSDRGRFVCTNRYRSSRWI